MEKQKAKTGPKKKVGKKQRRKRKGNRQMPSAPGEQTIC